MGIYNKTTFLNLNFILSIQFIRQFTTNSNYNGKKNLRTTLKFKRSYKFNINFVRTHTMKLSSFIFPLVLTLTEDFMDKLLPPCWLSIPAIDSYMLEWGTNINICFYLYHFNKYKKRT